MVLFSFFINFKKFFLEIDIKLLTMEFDSDNILSKVKESQILTGGKDVKDK